MNIDEALERVKWPDDSEEYEQAASVLAAEVRRLREELAELKRSHSNWENAAVLWEQRHDFLKVKHGDLGAERDELKRVVELAIEEMESAWNDGYGEPACDYEVIEKCKRSIAAKESTP